MCETLLWPACRITKGKTAEGHPVAMRCENWMCAPVCLALPLSRHAVSTTHALRVARPLECVRALAPRPRSFAGSPETASASTSA